MKADDVLPLLQICDLAKQWPGLKSIHDLAMAELVDAAAEAKDELDKRAEEEAKAAAEAEAERVAEAKKVKDAQDAADAKAAKVKETSA